MKIIDAILVSTLVFACNIGRTQPFDTLLLNYEHIRDIYPLEDSTFILVGEGENIIVERINQKAQVIWSARMGLNWEEDIWSNKINLTPGDSSIQILTTKRECDFHTYDNATAYTLNLLGGVIDSIRLPKGIGPWGTALLSGMLGRPRVGYIREEKVVLLYGSGDSVTLEPKLDIDTALIDLTGFIYRLTMCPDGDILIGTRGLFLYIYKKKEGIYKLDDIVYSPLTSDTRDLLCIEDDFFIVVKSNGLELKSIDGYHQTYFSPPGVFLESVSWRPPCLNVTASYFQDYSDTLYLLGSHLNQIYKEPRPQGYNRSGYAISDDWTFTVGGTFNFNEGGFLGSKNHLTNEGPKYDDLELHDFKIPEYQSYTFTYSNGPGLIIYHFPQIEVTITNHGDDAAFHATIAYDYSGFCGSIFSWEILIDTIDLLPGETKSYILKDVKFVNRFPYHYPLQVCLSLIRGDNREDDAPGNNNHCDEISLAEINPFSQEEHVKFFPNPVFDYLYFTTPEISPFKVDVYDLKGSKVISEHTHPYSQSHLNVSELPVGCYFLKFIFEDGRMFSGKFWKI